MLVAHRRSGLYSKFISGSMNLDYSIHHCIVVINCAVIYNNARSTNLANLSPNKFFFINIDQTADNGQRLLPILRYVCVSAWERLIRTQFIVQFNLVWVRATIYGTLTLRYDERLGRKKSKCSKHCPLSSYRLSVSTNAANDVKSNLVTIAYRLDTGHW